MSFLFVATDVGQLRSLQGVIPRIISAQGNVCVVVATDEPAGKHILNSPSFNFNCQLAVLEGTTNNRTSDLRSLCASVDRVFITLSPKANPNSAERLARVAAGIKPMFGYAEVPCGHRGPNWDGLLVEFDTLFVAQRTTDLMQASNVVEVGMEVASVSEEQARDVRSRLGIEGRWIWYAGGPYALAGSILGNIVGSVARFDRSINIVFSRHSRDHSQEALLAYCEAVAEAQRLGVSIVEISNDHNDGSTPAQLPIGERLQYSQLLNACSIDGMVITGHGTDGIRAPRMGSGIPAILCVGPLNPDLRPEKLCDRLPLPSTCPIQVTSYPALAYWMKRLFGDLGRYQELCQQAYPKQQQTPADIIVQYLLAQ